MNLLAQKNGLSLRLNCVTQHEGRKPSGQKAIGGVTQPCVTPARASPGYARLRNPHGSRFMQVRQSCLIESAGYADSPRREPAFSAQTDRS